jgi:hypothetical protein
MYARAFSEIQKDVEARLSKLEGTTDPALRRLLLREMKLLLEEVDSVIFAGDATVHSVNDAVGLGPSRLSITTVVLVKTPRQAQP